MGHIFWNETIQLIDSGENVDVLAIGDSWFHYPFNNLITPLHGALARPTIYVIGENGARADELSTGSWLANFRKMLATIRPSGSSRSAPAATTSPASATSTTRSWPRIAAARRPPTRVSRRAA